MRTVVKLGSRFYRFTTLLVIAVLVGFFGRGALANQGPPAQAPDSTPNAPVYERGSIVDQVAKVSSTSSAIFTSTAFTSVPGAYQYIFVPANVRALIDARFTAESACYRTTSTSAGGWCTVRTVIYSPTSPAVAAVEMNPAAGVDFAFDSTNGTGETASSWEGHALDRSYVVPASSTTRVWYVQVQAAVVGSGVALRLDDWHLTVDKARIP
jgi:hypothetical protein